MDCQNRELLGYRLQLLELFADAALCPFIVMYLNILLTGIPQ